MSAAQYAGVLRKHCNDVVDDLVFAARIGLLVHDIHAVTADEPYTKHSACHVRTLVPLPLGGRSDCAAERAPTLWTCAAQRRRG